MHMLQVQHCEWHGHPGHVLFSERARQILSMEEQAGRQQACRSEMSDHLAAKL